MTRSAWEVVTLSLVSFPAGAMRRSEFERSSEGKGRRPGRREGAVSIRMHCFLAIFLSSAFFVAGIIAFLLMLDRPWLGMGAMAAAFLFGGLVSHLFRKFIPARCPECRGPAFSFYKDDRRLCFQCRACGMVRETGFAESQLDE